MEKEPWFVPGARSPVSASSESRIQTLELLIARNALANTMANTTNSSSSSTAAGTSRLCESSWIGTWHVKS